MITRQGDFLFSRSARNSSVFSSAYPFSTLRSCFPGSPFISGFPAFVFHTGIPFSTHVLLPLPRLRFLSYRFGFIRCKGRPSRLIRRLEMYFRQILPFCERVIGRKSLTDEAVPTAGYRIHKTPKRFRQKGIERRENKETDY
ncbi:hypothetical protein [Bacteroides caecimuris]|uniref:hypothetical protein n=1 Tax=Bacteroides caecimuris TaxID=1796613 RepID=UPI001C3C1E28|nr:hypothetical protein [Bacteroides caecimuris]